MANSAAMLKGLYESFTQGDIPTVLAAMDPKIEWNEAEHVTFWPGQAFVGPDAVVQGVFARIPATFGDTFRIEVNRIVDCGSVVVMEGRYKGVVQATGKGARRPGHPHLGCRILTASSSSFSNTPTPGSSRRSPARRR